MREVHICSRLATKLQPIIARINGVGGAGAVTVGGVTFYLTPPDDRMRRHEAVHVAQQKRLGWRFYLTYAVYHYLYGYWDNPLEVEARKAEDGT